MVVTERYCSYEVAKLLKEKGFDIWCDTYYTRFGTFKYNLYKKAIDTSLACYAPTQQMACDWIFNKYGIHISLEYDSCIDCWEYHIYFVDKPNSHVYSKGIANKERAINYAIICVLTNYEPKEKEQE